MGRENHRVVSNLPQQPPIASAPKARFVVSWWDREVNVWLLRKPATEILNSIDEGTDLNQNRKLLKTIVIKGDSNISSASINEDGTLLVVSTAIDVKAFRLQHQDPARPSDVKLSAVHLPQELTRLGASKVQLSPDCSWLCLVQDGLRVAVAGIERAADSQDVTVPPNRIGRVARLRRHIPRYVQNGGLGRYSRNIAHVSFSADSRMLATADLAGYVDTWVLRTRDDRQNGAAEKETDDASASDSETSQSEPESVDDGSERWVRNPNGRLLPKLLGAPTVLSFSDDVPDAQGTGDYTLLTISSSWSVVAFHPLQGALTSWSRNHPRRALPAPIQDLLDLPKGVLWQGPRAWIYGVSFLFMLDLSQDLSKPSGDLDAPPADQVGLKRKRTGKSTGAGGKMAQSNLTPHQITRHMDGVDEDVDMDDVQPADDDDEDDSNSDDEMDGVAGELAQLRSGGEHTKEGGSAELADADSGRRSWWMTYKYRPIFGIVPLAEDEVALVERPTWDVEMPERYYREDR